MTDVRTGYCAGVVVTPLLCTSVHRVVCTGGGQTGARRSEPGQLSQLSRVSGRESVWSEQSLQSELLRELLQNAVAYAE